MPKGGWGGGTAGDGGPTRQEARQDFERWRGYREGGGGDGDGDGGSVASADGTGIEGAESWSGERIQPRLKGSNTYKTGYKSIVSIRKE